MRLNGIGCAFLSFWVLVWVTPVFGQAPGFPPTSVLVSPVEEREISSQIEVIGTVEAQLATTLSAETAGLAERFDLREGDFVEQEKALVVQLKQTDREINLAEADASHRNALVTLEKLRRGLRPEEIEERRAELNEKKALMDRYARDLEQAEKLVRSKVINLSEYNQTESNYLTAKFQHERATQTLRLAELGPREEDIQAQEAEVQRQKANLDRVREELRKTSLYSPISGFITRKYVEVGQWIAAGGQVVDIINIDQVLVRTGVLERYISQIQVGDRALVTVDAYPDQTFEGEVKHIVPEADRASRAFPVTIEIPNADYALKPGMFARVTIFYGPKGTALLVPKDAVVSEGSRSFLFLAEDSQARLFDISPGRVVGGFIEIKNGALSEGQRVIVTGNESLQDQSPVIVRGERRPDGSVIPVGGGGPGPGGETSPRPGRPAEGG
jgi:multidrug efflux pump subunit AcrA (membrane-fusion protein)